MNALHPELFCSFSAIQKTEQERVNFPTFLPFNQIFQKQKLQGALDPEAFPDLYDLGIMLHRLSLSLEFMKIDNKNIKVFGEIHLMFSRPCLVCLTPIENVELIPFVCSLFPQSSSFLTAPEMRLEPSFLTTQEGQEGLNIQAMIEHFLLRRFPFVYLHCEE